MRNLPSPLFIVGAAHSGKSELGIGALSKELGTAVLGTGDPNEPELAPRIDQLKSLRPKHWHHHESVTNLADDIQSLCRSYPQVLIDSLSQWAATLVVQSLNRYSSAQTLAQMEAETEAFIRFLLQPPPSRIVIISSEVGASVTPALNIPRLYREVAGRANARIAASCSAVVLVTCGIPSIIKSSR